MDKEHYKDMVLEQLDDINFYKELPSNEDKKTMSTMKKYTSKFSHNLTKKEIDFLLNFEVKTSNFYGLPKIHKSKQIQNGIQEMSEPYIKLPRPTDLKLRPIVAGPSCPTQRLSNLLDIILKPFCKLVPSFIRDDMDFLNHIPESIEENTKLVSFDVTSLYTNIPHNLGLEAISFWIDKHPDVIQPRFSKEFILEGLKIVLQNNHFFFDDKYYLQTKGTAMGTKVAPTYATLVLGFLEEKLFSECKTFFGEDFDTYIERNWKRYLDDCFIFWTKSLQDLQQFNSILNRLHESMHFTMEISENKLPFLDILIIKEGRKIITDLYYKSTDSHQYLIFNSCHPSHTKRNIPFNMARRICTIVIDEDRRNTRLCELRIFLSRQKYPSKLIEAAIQKAKEIPINELRTIRHHEEENNEKIPFVLTHNPRNHNIFKTAKQFFPIIQQSETLRDLIKPKDILHSRRQPPNLKKILTTAKFTSNPEKPMVSKCVGSTMRNLSSQV
ncbi:uncharacterized protein LOC134238563 [Saccostrea cucullata]|uniref:uncharacterized protein LOC134238563 n=1 Tax=Saccostrea cuccullata TaxID=36930 RepID=UPI002ED085EC